MTDGVPMREGAAQQLEQIYQEQTPLLLSAVRSLARQGYDMHPSEGLELIHDFYLEALPGLLGRYDASKAKFSTYLYAAFVRFARPRLLRNARWTRLFVSFDDALAHPAATVERDESLVEGVAKAVASLPRELKAVIEGRSARGESERQVAKRLGVTRYAVRQRMAEALGRIAIAIGEDAMIREDVRPLAIRLWRDGESLMSVAAELGLTRQEAREHLRQLVQSLSAAAGFVKE